MRLALFSFLLQYKGSVLIYCVILHIGHTHQMLDPVTKWHRSRSKYYWNGGGGDLLCQFCHVLMLFNSAFIGIKRTLPAGEPPSIYRLQTCRLALKRGRKVDLISRLIILPSLVPIFGNGLHCYPGYSSQQTCVFKTC